MLRAATDDDWQVFFGWGPPLTWFGYVAEDAHMLLGIGGVYFGTDDRWWITFKRAPGVRHRHTAQKAARMILDVVDRRGITVHALADPRISGAEFWLRRLGFTETAETLSGGNVWTYGTGDDDRLDARDRGLDTDRSRWPGRRHAQPSGGGQATCSL